MANWNTKANEIFLGAIEIADSQMRLAFLDQSCGSDAQLRGNVESLLAAHDAAGSFIDQPCVEATGDYIPRDADAAASADEGALAAELLGKRIGPYKLLQLLGEGGMGAVWVAEQEHPVKRRVALKLIKSGMDSVQVLKRFEAERQALALMDHPNIAKVLDAGTTTKARPYFVMELIKGIPITKFCDQEHLSPRERLELFVPVCQAVQHAHQKGIIHRDLKPSNVLVGLYDGKPIPKVIDFGVVKATGRTLTESTMYTEVGQIVGTLEYMAPEQAELNNLDIDTRADIYSLGVILYELLTGSPPFTAKQLRSAAFTEMLRMIREVEPPKPSTRLSSSDELPSIAANRKLEPRRLTKLVHGDLDWIVMKALEKDRARRYETANGLAMDIQRYLSDEPVLAGPPGGWYRLRKFVQRNRESAWAAGLILFCIALLVASQLRKIKAVERERQFTLEALEGEKQQRIIADEQRAKARQRAEELKLVSDFQAEMLGQVDPTRAGRLLTDDVQARFAAAIAKANLSDIDRKAEVSQFADQWKKINATDAARELIDRTILKPAVQAIDAKFKEQPVVCSHLQQVLAQRYCQLGLFDAALPLQSSALQTRRQALGDNHPDTYASIVEKAFLLQHLGAFAESEQLYQEALNKAKKLFGDDHADTLLAINNYGAVLQAQGKYTLAEPVLREAVEKCRRILSDDHPNTLFAINNLGFLHQSRGRLDEAEPLLRLALTNRRRVLGEDHSDTIISINNLGLLLQAKGQMTNAEPLYREALEKRRRILGEEHLDTLASINNLGYLLRNQGKLSDAETYYRDALAKARRVLTEEHPLTLTAVNNLGGLLKDQGKLEEAEPYCREAAAALQRKFGMEHPFALMSIGNLADLLVRQGKNAEVVATLGPIEDLVRQKFTDGNFKQAAGTLYILGKAHLALRNYEQAASRLIDAHSLFLKATSNASKDADLCSQALVDLFNAWHAAQPDQGHDKKAAEWKAKLEAKMP